MSANLIVDISIEILEKGIKIWNIGDWRVLKMLSLRFFDRIKYQVTVEQNMMFHVQSKN